MGWQDFSELGGEYDTLNKGRSVSVYETFAERLLIIYLLEKY